MTGLGRLSRLLALVLPLAAPAAGELLGDPRVERRTAADPGAVVAELVGSRAERWLTWSVPAPDGAETVCCFDRSWRERRCVLGERLLGWGSSSDFRPRYSATLDLFVRVGNGRVRDLVLASPSCAVDARGERLVALDGVDTAASARAFGALARDAGEEVAERSVAALAHHRSAEADGQLATLVADRTLEADLRRSALYWAGEMRGEAGVALAERTLASERDEELLDGAAFALAESEVPRAAERLVAAARAHPLAEVRSKALFWLSQADGDRHAETIYAAAFDDRDADVREQAVFALSELEGGTVWLVRLLREASDAEVRRQALFWLGQSDDPRAMAALEEILR
ncbi:MAG: hypothetical protein NDJ75_06540 [Thermoanaerobaculia bacterium]|nr:hypothetical protein [Thermoanaerobaculia bacterium]